jgi:hypothetical protein
MSGVNSLVPSNPPPPPPSGPVDDPGMSMMQQATTLLQSGQHGVATYFYRQAAGAFDDQARTGDVEVSSAARWPKPPMAVILRVRATGRERSSI